MPACERQFLDRGVAGGRRLLSVAHQLCANNGGNLNGSVVLTDNHLNASSPYATQTISLSGIAAQPDATSMLLSISPNPAAPGSPVTVPRR